MVLIKSLLFALPIIGAVNAAVIAPRNGGHKEPEEKTVTKHEYKYKTDT